MIRKGIVMKINQMFFLCVISSIFTVSGCANTGTSSNADAQLQTVQAENTSLSDKVKSLTQNLMQKDTELTSTKSKLSTAEMTLSSAAMLPSGSSSGDCFGLASDGKTLMKTICASAMTSGTVKSIQRALSGAGFSPGPIDGIIGSRTMSAVNAYQKAKSLMQGSLSMETIKSLGLM